ncbi:MerR family transcriptional regulator [uncultured Clostridium sp.]|uniref:MerR family transcriptional regulator n=1 Tax=uncultured Clostridium sp. TaxID=59620 RepID=UPI003216DA2C
MKDYENYNDVSYSSVPDDDECVLNAVQISKMVGEPASTIRLWADMYENFLCVKRINGRMVYTQKSVNEFKFIQSLIRDKKFKHEQVNEQLSKRGFEYSKYDGGLINLEDPLGFEALASQLAIKTQEQLKEFLMKFAEYQENFKKELKEDIKTEVAVAIDEHMDAKLDELKSYIDQRELEYRTQDQEKIDILRKAMEDTRKKNEEDSSKKGFLSRIFNK